MQPSTIDQSLRLYAKLLKLPTFSHIDDTVSQFQPGQSLKELILQLMQHEYENRQEKARQRRLKLVTELREAKDGYHLRKMEKSIAAADLLLLDELSYASFGIEESELLFKVIAERSERTSTMITTNLEFPKWPTLFRDATLVTALVDRLTYHSHILNMNGESYRFKSSRGRNF